MKRLARFLPAGCGDNAGAAVAMDTLEDGACNISLGTSGTIFLASNHFVKEPSGTLHSFCHANGKYHLLACILTAASARKWWIEDILQGDYAEDEAEVLRSAETDVIFLPYLSGERSPHNDPNASGAFIKLKASTKRGELSYAVMEGVAFALKDCLLRAKEDGIAIKEATICGGGTRSKAWCQILADVLQMPLRRVNASGPSFGAAILAMGECPKDRRDPKAGSLFLPRNNLRLEEKFLKFRRLYPLLKDL